MAGSFDPFAGALCTGDVLRAITAPRGSIKQVAWEAGASEEQARTWVRQMPDGTYLRSIPTKNLEMLLANNDAFRVGLLAMARNLRVLKCRGPKQ